MALLGFTPADVARLLHVRAHDVEVLISTKVLEVSGYTRRGRPLFDVDSVRRAAEHVAREQGHPT